MSQLNLFPALDAGAYTALSIDERIAHWRERQRHVLWAITKMEQKIGDWEKNGFTDAEQLATARRAERDKLMQLFSHSKEVVAIQKKKVKEVFEVATCEQLFATVQTHVYQQQQIPTGGVFLYCGFVGSRQYNLQNTHSDYDLFIIWHPPSDGLPVAADVKSGGSFQVSPTRYDTVKNALTFKPDYTIHSSSKFISLLLDSDPRIVECLFTDYPASIGHVSNEWRQLQRLRSAFVTRRLLAKYASHINRELEAIHSGLFTRASPKYRKKMYVMARLVTFVRQIMAKPTDSATAATAATAGTTAIRVWFDTESKEHAALMTVRAGKFVHDQLIADARACVADCDKWIADEKCPLPASAEPMRDAVTKWLSSITPPVSSPATAISVSSS